MTTLPEQSLEPIHQRHDSEPSLPIAGVALDMDGLLFDTERIYWQVGDTILQRRGHRYCAALQARMMGRIGTAAVEQMIAFHKLNDQPADLLQESDQLYGELLPQLLRPMPGLEQWIGHLQQSSVPFALTTSSRRVWVDVIFAELDWRNSLQFVLTGDDVTHGKPHPEMYLTAAQRFGFEPNRMLVLEDSGNGCAAGVAAGAQVVAIPNEHTRTQEFSGALLVADSLLDQRLWKLVS
ncbi:HAD-IA family hydrolase [Stieleria sp. TO1_6]|uniref:HAD family hydrolase n=1 Tax=Stieleria tagensis TaxID=2956795 RepID=UPI00209B4FA6|nr:HAD-IA family hydrolase [Stieleria tagensis]MCO8121037.1 HAD-IA family hydrolase [Stieleria tagensis]